MEIYRLERQKAIATGHPEGSGKRPKFRVLAGSTAMRNGSPNVKRKEDLTARLAQEGVLAPHPRDAGLWLFTKDFLFTSASAAGDVINDGNLSAPQYWVSVNTGETLKDWLLRTT